MDNIFISSGGFRKKLINEVADYVELIGCKNIEYSSGPYQDKIIDKFLNLEIENFTVQIHNYFPVPQKPFVLNLASLNKEIWQNSFNHCLKSINLASKLKTKRYSAHCGFCYDPKTSDLGRPFKKNFNFNKEDYDKKFIDTIIKLKNYADIKEVDFYIENNVLISENLRNEQNPLLGTTMDEMEKYKQKTDVKILIDTGHLIVSSKTLKINESNQLDLAKNLADAYHLSTNNRLRDQNKEFNNKDKIMQAVRKDADFYTIEVYSKLEGIKKSLENLISFLK